jgi:hypothetical protein
VRDCHHAYAQEHAERLRKVLAGFAKQKLTQREMVVELNALGVKSARGGQWHLQTLQRVQARLAAQ